MEQKMITPKDYVGLTEELATNKAESKGLLVRITERDGKKSMLTMEARSDRVNFSIYNGNVVDAYGG